MLENKINVAINRDLRKKYGIRQFPIVKGDIVKIISGSRKGEGGIGRNSKGWQVNRTAGRSP